MLLFAIESIVTNQLVVYSRKLVSKVEVGISECRRLYDKPKSRKQRRYYHSGIGKRMVSLSRECSSVRWDSMWCFCWEPCRSRPLLRGSMKLLRTSRRRSAVEPLSYRHQYYRQRGIKTRFKETDTVFGLVWFDILSSHFVSLGQKNTQLEAPFFV